MSRDCRALIHLARQASKFKFAIHLDACAGSHSTEARVEEGVKFEFGACGEHPFDLYCACEMRKRS